MYEVPFLQHAQRDFTTPPLTTDQHYNLYITTTTTDCLLPPTNTMSLLPPTEDIYPDPATAFTAIQAHARQHGYTVFQRDKRSRDLRYKQRYMRLRVNMYCDMGILAAFA